MPERGVEKGGVRLLRLLVLMPVLASPACQTAGEVRSEIGSELRRAVPSTRWTARVVRPAERGAYLDARIESDDSSLRYLFPNREPCRSVLRDGASVEFVNLGTFGKVAVGDDECDPIGTLSLAAWRDRRARRPVGRGPARPRAQATYNVFYTDDEWIFLRGRFPLTGLVGIPGGSDTIAVVTNAAPCSELAERRVASLEYRQKGPALVLLTPEGECPVEGIALPLRE